MVRRKIKFPRSICVHVEYTDDSPFFVVETDLSSISDGEEVAVYKFDHTSHLVVDRKLI